MHACKCQAGAALEAARSFRAGMCRGPAPARLGAQGGRIGLGRRLGRRAEPLLLPASCWPSPVCSCCAHPQWTALQHTQYGRRLGPAPHLCPVQRRRLLQIPAAELRRTADHPHVLAIGRLQQRWLAVSGRGQGPDPGVASRANDRGLTRACTATRLSVQPLYTSTHLLLHLEGDFSHPSAASNVQPGRGPHGAAALRCGCQAQGRARGSHGNAVVGCSPGARSGHETSQQHHDRSRPSRCQRRYVFKN